jgi:uncharacterized protein YceK
MKLMKKLVIVTALPVLLSSCGAVKGLEAGAEKLAHGLGVAMASPYNKLGSQWCGKPLSKFQDKFGAATSRSGSGEDILLTWQRSRVVHMPGRWRSEQTFLPNMTITRRYFVPEHDGDVSCTVALTEKGGTISQVKTLSDELVPIDGKGLFPGNTSACQIVFGL